MPMLAILLEITSIRSRCAVRPDALILREEVKPIVHSFRLRHSERGCQGKWGRRRSASAEPRDQAVERSTGPTLPWCRSPGHPEIAVRLL